MWGFPPTTNKQHLNKVKCLKSNSDFCKLKKMGVSPCIISSFNLTLSKMESNMYKKKKKKNIEDKNIIKE